MPNGYPPPGLETETDAELNAISRPALEGALAANLARRGQAAGTGTLHEDGPSEEELGVKWAWLQERHDDWDGKFWQECRALYAGGKRLLGDDKVLTRLFPANLYEDPQIYAQRKARAHYYAYAGAIVDQLLSGLGTAPLRLNFGARDEADGSYAGDEWWESFAADVTREAQARDGEDADSEERDEDGSTMHNFCVDLLREAMQTEWVWVACDLPRADEAEDEDEDDEPVRPLDEPYLCIVPAEEVVDWEDGADGRLKWVLTMTTCRKREKLSAKRGIVTHTYTLWTRTDWVRYVIEVDPKNPPSPDTVYAPADRDDHDFGRVPFERFRLPEGIWAMGKMHSLAREHFNKRCAQSHAEYKALHPILYEFQGPEDKGALPTPGAQTDPDRAISQIRGQGYSQIRGADDDARYIGPDPAAFKEARESCSDVMREMHRVMFSMALSANMDNKALNRSGESKDKDNAVTEVLLGALGRIVRRWTRKLLALTARVGGKKLPPVQLAGLDSFNIKDVTSKITQAVELFNGVPILSQTWKSLYLTDLYVATLGDGLTPSQIEDIRGEVEEAGTAEEAMMAQGMIPGIGGPTLSPLKELEAKQQQAEDDAEEEDEPPPKKLPAAPAGRRTMMTGKR